MNLLSTCRYFSSQRIVIVLLTFLICSCGGGNKNTEQPPAPPAQVVSCPDLQTLSVEAGLLFQIPPEINVLIQEALSREFSKFTLTQKDNIYFTPIATEPSEHLFGVSEDCSQGLLAVTVTPTQLDLSETAVAPYALESGNISRFDALPKDTKNIPLRREKDGSTSYFPIMISKVAQVYYAKIVGGNYLEEDYQTMLNLADWLVENCELTAANFCVWKSSASLPVYKLPPKWTSAMAQGQAISALAAIYSITGETKYIETAINALHAFYYDLAEDGVAAQFGDNIWFDEFGSIEQPAHVLNGFIFAITSLKHADSVLNSNIAKQIFDLGIASLKDKVHLYDLKFTTRYDYSPLNQLASTKDDPGDKYHELHVIQFAHLASLTNENFAEEYARKFLYYDTGGFDTYAHLKQDSVKISNIEIKDAGEPQPVEALIDSRWEWGDVISFTGDLLQIRITLNTSPDETELFGLRLTSTTLQKSPAEISIANCNSEDEIFTAKRSDSAIEYTHISQNNHKSITHVYNFNVAMDSNCVLIKLHSAPESQRLVLRELSVYPQQEDFLQKLIRDYTQKTLD